MCSQMVKAPVRVAPIGSSEFLGIFGLLRCRLSDTKLSERGNGSKLKEQEFLLQKDSIGRIGTNFAMKEKSLGG